jgi:hypothetical protein
VPVSFLTSFGRNSRGSQAKGPGLITRPPLARAITPESEPARPPPSRPRRGRAWAHRLR